MKVIFDLSEIEQMYLEVLLTRHLHRVKHLAGEWDYLKVDRIEVIKHRIIFEKILEQLREY